MATTLDFRLWAMGSALELGRDFQAVAEVDPVLALGFGGCVPTNLKQGRLTSAPTALTPIVKALTAAVFELVAGECWFPGRATVWKILTFETLECWLTWALTWAVISTR